ncbi:endoplasmic reticulum junction formation protein lunapark-A [Condylostylus longicornis]|uniref:endoplasmic reticulum junction formation protein lunapark-A n=1 Tax=Condylostylus longicornis TaxID=2530218 RepID=UPI00244DCE60|nr:endoplasmic reticulum junction formation protein lunapark-A [Condylostylus longicornis]
MGAILAKFRKEKTTIEILERLDEEIKEIEEYTISTQARQKRYVGNLLVISIGLYILCFIVFYFAFFPPTWMERVTYSVPLLIFPFVIFLLKHLVAWFFQRKLNDKSIKLKKLRGEKKKVLEKVMDKETYKVALEILNRFGDKSNGLKGATPMPPKIEVSTPAKQSPLQNKQQPNSQSQVLIRRSTPVSQQQPQLVRGPLAFPNTPGGISSPSTPLSHLQAIQQRASPMPMQMQQQIRRRTPFPFINPHNKSVLDKFVDYLIGDGIQNRFAMICKECYSHNGMALQDEYEYTPFRCVYCNAINPSKKSRPVAPKLPETTGSNVNLSQNATVSSLQRDESTDSEKVSSSDKYSGSDTEDEKLKLATKEINKDVEEEIYEQNIGNSEDIENKDTVTENPMIEKED